MLTATGRFFRAFGRSVDRVGAGLQGSLAYIERLVPQTTSVPIKNSVPATSNAAFIAPNSSIVGDATVKEGAAVWFNCVLRGDRGAVTIGERSTIGDRSTIEGSSIGSGVTVGPNSAVVGATIGDQVLIGANSMVGEGVKVGARAIIEPGSVVPAGTTVTAGHIFAGNPAVSVRAVTEEEINALSDLVAENIEKAEAYAHECDKSYQDLVDEEEAKQIQEQLESDHWRDANVGRVEDRQGNIFNRRQVQSN